MLREIAPGIHLLGTFGLGQTGIWLLRHEDECAILEMPPTTDDDPDAAPWETLDDVMDEEGLYLKFITATHQHPDHFDAFAEFYYQFDESPVLVHASFFEDELDVSDSRMFAPADLDEGTLAMRPPTLEWADVPVYCYENDVFETHLAGEPLFLIHAPKHSLTDVLVVFRGCVITGDWWLGPGDPNWNAVPAGVVQASIDRVIQFTRDHEYVIHSAFSAHANEFRRGIDVVALFEASRPPVGE